jgi:hypothetical protein
MSLPARESLTVCFAHVAYRMADRFALRQTGIRHFEVRSIEELTVRIADADVLSVSGLWRNSLIGRAPSSGSSSRSAPAPTSIRATASRPPASASPAGTA